MRSGDLDLRPSGLKIALSLICNISTKSKLKIYFVSEFVHVTLTLISDLT